VVVVAVVVTVVVVVAIVQLSYLKPAQSELASLAQRLKEQQTAVGGWRWSQE
jgi:Tfp pilus assembly protein PilO